MTEYERELVARLKHREKWPKFEHPEFLGRLDSFAERVLKKRSVEGNLAAILIYHQLVEEMLKLLVQYRRFLAQVADRPSRIVSPTRPKQMFGQLQDELRHQKGFRGIPKLLALTGDLNDLRIEVVHKLAKRQSLGLTREGRRAKELYDCIFRVFGDIQDDFHLALNRFRKELADEPL